MSKILITGATGFIGRSLVPALIAAGHEVRCAVWKKNEALQVEQTVINKLEQQIDWTQALADIEIVIHLAARVHMLKDEARAPQEEYCKINSIATKNLAEQAAHLGVKRFIFLSTIKVNGEYTLENLPFDEMKLAQPDDPYAKSKLLAEHYLKEICEQSEMHYVILRPPLVYGPEVKANFLKLLQLAANGWPLPFGKIPNKRSFIFIDNLVSAILTVVEHPKAANQLYLVADNDACSLSDLLKILSEAMQIKPKLFPVPVALLAFIFKLLGLNHLNLRLLNSLEVSNNKIKSQLGWNPPVTSQQGFIATATWYHYDHNS